MITHAQLVALQRQLSGKVLIPSQSEYTDVLEIDNGRIEASPRLIVQVDGIEDVRTTLRFARCHGLRFTVKAGGHSATGYSLNSEGVVIDMSLMNHVQIDTEAQTVTVGTGARWQQIYIDLMNTGTGLIPIGGGCPTVGVAGFMQGGGYSFVSRSYGMSIDNLLWITVVLADGSVHTVSPDSESPQDCDLFWALRGGGGGNFGVAVEMGLRVHQPNTPKMLTGQLRFLPTQAQDVLGFYNTWIESLPNQMAIYGIWGMIQDPANPDDPNAQIETFGFTTIYNGDPDEGMKLLAPLLAHGPLTSSFNALTLPEFELINGKTTLVDRRAAYIRAGVMPKGAFTPEAIAVFQRYMANPPSKDSFLVWTHGGGEIETVAPDATAFVHRHGRFIPELKAIWTTPDEARINIEWAHAFFRDLEPHFQGSYVNYIDPLLTDWARKYYGDNLPRLRQIKAAIDPDGSFDFQQSVNSRFEPSTAQPLDLAPLNRTFVTGMTGVTGKTPFEVLSANEQCEGGIVTIVAKWSYLEGKRDQAIAALQDLAHRVETREPFVFMYTIHTVNFGIQSFPIPSANDIVFLSIFANKAAFEFHLEGPVFNDWLAENTGLFLTNSGGLFVVSELLERQAGFIRQRLVTTTGASATTEKGTP